MRFPNISSRDLTWVCLFGALILHARKNTGIGEKCVFMYLKSIQKKPHNKKILRTKKSFAFFLPFF